MDLIQELDYFHGYIDAKECQGLLADSGDFLLRHHFKASNDFSSETYVCVISLAKSGATGLAADHNNKERIQNVPICQAAANGEYYTIHQPAETFPTVKALINSLMATRKCLAETLPPIIRPVARPDWELLVAQVAVPPDEVKLGKGSFGTVVKGKLLKGTPIDVAVKRVNEGMNEVLLADVLQEARIMRHINHNNVIKLYGVVVETLPIQLVIELVEGGVSLSQKLKDRQIPVGSRLSLVFGLMYGLGFVHDKEVIHRDVAARNVLVSHDCRDVKLIDFGLSRRGPTYCIQTAQKIPTKWLSPEVCLRGIFSFKSDVWAFGVTVWEIFHDGAEPYGTRKNAEVRAFLADRKALGENVLNLNNTTSEEKPAMGLDDVVRRIFRFSPEARPTMARIISMIEADVLMRLSGIELDQCTMRQQQGAFVSSRHNTAQSATPPSKRSDRNTVQKSLRREKGSRGAGKRGGGGEEGGGADGKGGEGASSRRGRKSMSVSMSKKKDRTQRTQKTHKHRHSKR